jgi:hypothetical protein
MEKYLTKSSLETSKVEILWWRDCHFTLSFSPELANQVTRHVTQGDDRWPLEQHGPNPELLVAPE